MCASAWPRAPSARAAPPVRQQLAPDSATESGGPQLYAFLQKVVAWFVPAHMADDIHARKRAQMFVISHLFRAADRDADPLFLWITDQQPACADPGRPIYGFWPFLALLAVSPRLHAGAAGVINLTFCIMWARTIMAGRVPLPRLVRADAAARLHVSGLDLAGARLRLRAVVLAIAALYVVYLFGDFPVYIPVEDMVVAGCCRRPAPSTCS